MNIQFQTNEIFETLTKEIAHLINEDIIFTNDKGIIVASTEDKRHGSYHEGAFLAMKQKEKMIMTKELTESLKGVKKGVVIPIFVEHYPIGVVGITGDPHKVERYGRIVQTMAELFIKGTLDQMNEETMLRNLELFVFDWLQGNLGKSELVERSELYNLTIQRYSQVIMIRTRQTKAFTYNDLSLLKTEWEKQTEALFVRWGQGRLLIIDEYQKQNATNLKLVPFMKRLNYLLGAEDIYVGIGQKASYHNLAESLKQADIACLTATDEQRIMYESDLRFEMLQYELSNETKRKFVERTIGPIYHDQVLMDTLIGWINNNMSIQKTSAALHIHKNTLYYRLDKISELLQLNVRQMDDVSLTYISIQFLKEFDL